MLILFLLSIELLDRDTSEKETSKRERERGREGELMERGGALSFLYGSLFIS
jgi:hypothetical protein